MSRHPALDGLRALAILLVIVTHLSPLASGLRLGVNVFFVISGYLITTLLLTEQETAGIRLRLFYVRRALRLFPALIAMVAVVTVLSSQVAWWEAGAALTYTSNIVMVARDGFIDPFSHTWSLALEEQFYLLWPLALLLVRNRGHALRWTAVVACVSVAAAVALPMLTSRILVDPVTQAHGLLIGCILALRPTRFHASRAQGNGGLVCILILAGLASLWPDAFPVASVLAELCTAVVIVAFVADAPAVMTSAPAVWIGRRSYGIYLWHYPLIIFGSGHIHPDLLGGAVGVGCAFVAAAGSFRYVETPFLRLKDRLRPEPLQVLDVRTHRAV